MDLSQSSEDSFEVGPTVVSSSFYQSPSKQVRFEGALLSPIEKESRIAPIDSQPKSGAFPYETYVKSFYIYNYLALVLYL